MYERILLQIERVKSRDLNIFLSKAYYSYTDIPCICQKERFRGRTLAAESVFSINLRHSRCAGTIFLPTPFASSIITCTGTCAVRKRSVDWNFINMVSKSRYKVACGVQKERLPSAIRFQSSIGQRKIEIFRSLGLLNVSGKITASIYPKKTTLLCRKPTRVRDDQLAR